MKLALGAVLSGIIFILFSAQTCSRPLTKEEAAALQGIPSTFDPPPEAWYFNTQSGADGKEDLDGIEGDACSGLVEEACGTDSIPGDTKTMAKDQCKRSFCHPVCTTLTWDCVGSASNDKNGIVNFETKNEFNILQPAVLGAICAQVKAEACTNIMKCCKKDDPYIFNWVEDMALQPDGIQTMVPSPICAHDATNKGLAESMCSTCMAEAKLVQFGIMKGACLSLGDIPGGVPDWSGVDIYKTEQEGLPPQVEEWVPKLADGKRLSLREKCTLFQEKFQQEFESKVTEMATPKKICQCLGCCDQSVKEDQCWFPIGATYPAPT